MSVNQMFKTAALAGVISLGLSVAVQAAEIKGWNTHAPDYPVSVAMDHFGKVVAEKPRAGSSRKPIIPPSWVNRIRPLSSCSLAALISRCST
ncbi:MAG: hypothetical protein R3E89_14210 [Thiolinea sp.]